MPAPSDDPLRKVPINLREFDCAAMENLYGHGWTGIVRELVKYHVKEKIRAQNKLPMEEK